MIKSQGLNTGREIEENALPTRTHCLSAGIYIYTVHRMIAGEREDESVLHREMEKLSSDLGSQRYRSW